jgi:hypothetical protein
MAAYNKFEKFSEDLGLGVHNFHATTGHILKVYASAGPASASADAVKADLAEITAQNGYPAGGTDIQNTWTRSGLTSTLAGTDVTWTASGGPFGPLQVIPLYNDSQTVPAKPLIGWWDYGSSITVNDGESFTVDFGASILTLT